MSELAAYLDLAVKEVEGFCIVGEAVFGYLLYQHCRAGRTLMALTAPVAISTARLTSANDPLPRLSLGGFGKAHVLVTW